MRGFTSRIFSPPPLWRGKANGAAWLALAVLSAGMAVQALLGPHPPATTAASRGAAAIGLAAAPGLNEEIATLGAQSQALARQQLEARTRLAALEDRLASITGSLPPAPGAPEQPQGTAMGFGVELARATDIGEIDAVWEALRQLHGAELAALAPAIRISGTAAARELALIAGPLGQPREAARICAILRAEGQSCREVPFAGEMIRLAPDP